MSRHRVLVFKEMRPPVASLDGESPLRGKNANKVFDLANGIYEDRAGFRITKEQLVGNYTDDGRLADMNWNGRHHICPT